MKNLLKLALGLLVCVSLFSCDKDDEKPAVECCTYSMEAISMKVCSDGVAEVTAMGETTKDTWEEDGVSWSDVKAGAIAAGGTCE